MGAIPKDPTRSNRTFTIVVGVLVVLTSLPVLGIVLLSTSVVNDHLAPTGAILGVLFAAIPVVPLVYAFLWLDRYEPEPKSLLALGLGWGAFVAVAAALIVQSVGALVAGWSQPTQLAIVAPVTEEAAKGLFLLVLLVAPTPPRRGARRDRLRRHGRHRLRLHREHPLPGRHLQRHARHGRQLHRPHR